MISSTIPSQLIAPAAELLAYLVDHSDAAYAFMGQLPPDEPTGIRVFGPTASRYYQLLEHARMYASDSPDSYQFNDLQHRFAEYLPSLVRGEMPATAFAKTVDG